MEVLHRAESGFYRLAKVIEEAGEGESKKVLIEYVWERFTAFTDPQIYLLWSCLGTSHVTVSRLIVIITVTSDRTTRTINVRL